MVEITNASNLMPKSITVVEDGTTIEITTTPTDVSINTGVVTIQTGGITSVNGDAGPVVVLNTDDISEGVTNQYYTDARVDANFATKTTTDLTEGTNLYYTDTRFDTRLGNKTTTDLAEGTNLYYTDGRVNTLLGTKGYATETYVNTELANLVDSAPVTLDTLNELAAALGDDPNFATTTATALGTKLENINNESIGDLSDVDIATSVANGDLLYWNDTVGLWQNVSPTSDDIPEGDQNLYYTDGRVQSVIDTNTAGFITASSSDTLTNKSGLISQWTNDAGYLTSETDSQTLSFANPNLTISNGNTVDLSALTPTSLDWTAITNTPTTISGYGITDAYTTTNFNTDFATKTTTDLTEGTNLYYTDARAQAVSINALSEDTVPQLSADLDANNNYITNLLDPINNQDAATKLYVDSSIAGASVTTSTATILEVRNTTGSAIAKGVPVYISGHSGNKILVAPADADDPTKMPAIGLMNATLSNNSDGEVISFGLITGIDMSTFSIGDTLYIDTTPGGSTFGGLTNTPPTGETSAIQNIGKVARNVSNGEFVVSGPGRSNATPNLDTDQFFLGNASNQAEAVDFSNAVEAISINAVSEDITPVLGGELDANSNNIINVNNIGVNGTLTGTNAFGIQMPDGIDLNGTGIIQSHNGAYQPVSIEGGALINNNNGGDYALNVDHPNVTGRGIQVRQGISGTAQTSGQLMRLRSADAFGFAERFSVNYDGSVKINNSYTFPLNDGSANQVLTTDGLGNLTFATPAAGYGDSDVDTHLNTSTASVGQVLSWTGSDYDWVAQGGGSGSFSGDLAGSILTDSTGDVTISSLKGTNSHTSLTGEAIATNTSIDLASGSDLNVDVKNGYITLTEDISNGTGATFDRSYHIFDTQGYNYNASDRITGFRVDVRHGNSDFATNGQGNIKEIFGSIYDLMRNANGSSDNTIEDIVGMRQRIRDDFDTTNLNSVLGIELNFDSGLSNATTLKSITTNNEDAVMEHWGPIEVGPNANIIVGNNKTGSIKVINKLNQTDPLVETAVNNNTNSNPVNLTNVDQNVTDSQHVVEERRKGYYTSHSGQDARVKEIFQAPNAGSTATPQVGYSLDISRPVYNANSGVTSNINDQLLSFQRFGASGFWLSNGSINVPARQSISFGFPIQYQQGFENPFVASNGGTSINSNLLTETGQMPSRIVFSYNTGAVSTYAAISDAAWNATEMGTANSVYDKLWAFGCSWTIDMEASIPSGAANATVTLTQALPPAGVIASFPGDTGGYTPLYANVPSWMNTSTRTLTMTRPATGKTYYRWRIEFSDQTLFAKDFEEFNLS